MSESGLPKRIFVNSIPYTIEEDPHTDFVSKSDMGSQVISVVQHAALPRKRLYVLQEVAYLLMVAAGIPQGTCNRYSRSVGSVLYRLVVDNCFDWIRARKEPPATIWINGLSYMINREVDDILAERELGGRITYDTLTIEIRNDMEVEITQYTVAHELAHGIFYEALAGNLHEKEEYVEAFGWQLYYFLRDNDMNLFKPKGE